MQLRSEILKSAYPNALILAHPQLSHAQAIEICRREGLRIVQTKRGNFIYESSQQAPVAARTGGVLPAPDRPAAGPDLPEAA